MATRKLEKERFGLGSISTSFVVAGLLAVVIPSLYFAVIARNQNTAQNTYIWWLEESIIDNSTQLQGFIISNATATNTTIADIQLEIQNIENVLNMTENTAIMTINGVTADNVTFNLELVAGNNMIITADPSNNRILLESTAPPGGIQTITSTDGSITVVTNGTSVDLSNNGVRNLNGMTGSVTLIGKDGITIMTNDSGVVVCAPGITSAISDLQMEDSTQAMQIMSLQTQVSEHAMEIQALQEAGITIEQMFNNTDMDIDAFNMTILALIAQVNMMQAQVDILQEQVNNFTSVSAPTGAIMTWSGTSGSIPSGFLYCDGTEYDMTTYAALFAVVGTNFCGGGCGGGMFAVPDMRGRVPVGVGGAAFTILGDQTIGEETHVLTTAEMTDHFHNGNANSNGDHFHSAITNSETNHHHTVPLYGTSDGNQYSASGYPLGGPCGASTLQMTNAKYMIGGTNLADIELSSNPGEICWQMYATSNSGTGHVHDVSVSTAGAHTHTLNIFSAGSSDAHNNIQPSTVVNYMIKT